MPLLEDVAPPAFEVEAKVRLDAAGRAALERRLAELGARAGPAQVQEDVFFAHPQRDFAATDEALRLRRVGARLELTYKGPKEAGAGPKARIEETVPLAADPTRLLAALGFRPAARLAKERVPYDLGSGVHVVLDRLAGLGDFAEVEAVGADRAEAARRVEDALRRLGLEAAPQLRESYLELALGQAGKGPAGRVASGPGSPGRRTARKPKRKRAATKAGRPARRRRAA